MTQEEKEEFVQVLERMYLKTIELSAMMKDGKFIIAHEKLGGLTKIIQQLSTRIGTVEVKENS